MAGKRAQGINAVMAAAYETTYGTSPTTGFLQLPFVTSQLGEERPLIEDDQLGFGREGLDPTYDVATNDGDVVVPVDTRAFGFWLKLLFGAPTTVALAAASGAFTFSAQPAANATITLAGTVFTFVASGPTGNQILIGANLAATLVNAATALNASSVPAIAAATYAVSGSKLTVVFDIAGVTGNAFTLAAQAASNAVPSGATLSGGTNSHTFTSGSANLPSASLEVGLPEVPDYAMNYGGAANQLKISMGRSGMLNATISMICQGELPGVDATAAGTTTPLRGPRFAQATGSITMDGSVLGEVVTADVSYSNNLDKDEIIRSDGRIGGVDPGASKTMGTLNVKYATRALKAKAESQVASAVVIGWTKDAASLTLTQNRVFLPKVKNPVSGPKGIVAAYSYQGSGASGPQLTAVLVNDVVSY